MIVVYEPIWMNWREGWAVVVDYGEVTSEEHFPNEHSAWRFYCKKLDELKKSIDMWRDNEGRSV